ncbi:30S ribosome-binding factor RbfA [Candidatus Portiera aleyrodidarum]|uniref:Ribosome-binding factor A n=1 Tax=Candidatus Portiera aleyrodidarum TaxID=91844 RepID=A0A8D9JTH1_9GAMM|nr:30S ribosome-binding factor RbfA [Candidatus Portiera aleyrodidarum]CEI58552.1 Ribosome-binding factor A [Candidatus Portiera aleyrodidarum]
MKYRIRKISELIKKDLAYLIQYKLKDPRIKKIIIIQSVIVSKDIKYAEIYWTIMNENKKNNIYAKILKLASGYLRSKLYRNIKIHQIPKLRFHYDVSINRSYKLNKLINKIIGENI